MRAQLVTVAVVVALASCTDTEPDVGATAWTATPSAAQQVAASSVATTPASGVTAEKTAACRQVGAAVRAQEQRDLRAAEQAMYAAWRAGRGGSDEGFVQKLLEPGDLEPGDTQTLNEVVDVLALACGLQLAR